MFRDDGKPRYWIGWYDRWHILLPIALATVLFWLLFAPRSRPVPGRFHSGATNSASTPLPALRSQSPTTIRSPYPGQIMWPSRMSDAHGTSEPRALVRLFLGQRKLGETYAETNGHWRFQLANFPPGNYRARAEAWTGLQAIPSQEIEFTVTREPGSASPGGSKQKRAAPKKNVPK